MLPVVSLQAGPKTHLGLLWSPEPRGAAAAVVFVASFPLRLLRLCDGETFSLPTGRAVGEKGGQRGDVCPAPTCGPQPDLSHHGHPGSQLARLKSYVINPK